MSKYLEDEERLHRLQTGGESEWRAWYDDMREPFRLFFMKYARLEPSQAIELYQEAQVIFHRNVSSGKLSPDLKSTLKTYLFGIGKLLHLKKGGSGGNWEEEIPDQAVPPEIEVTHEQKSKAELVRRLLDQLDGSCRKVLELVYIQGFVMEAVARELGLPSEGAARKKKFDCLKKLRDLIV